MTLSRRNLLKLVPALGLGQIPAFKILGIERAAADDRVFKHGNSLFGDLKYPPDFKHFDYVSVTAPKGGRFSHLPSSYAYNQNLFTFNSLNSYVRTGDSATGMEAKCSAGGQVRKAMRASS